MFFAVLCYAFLSEGAAPLEKLGKKMDNSEVKAISVKVSDLLPGHTIVGALGSRLYIEGEVYASSSMPGFTVIETDITSMILDSDYVVEVIVE